MQATIASIGAMLLDGSRARFRIATSWEEFVPKNGKLMSETGQNAKNSM